MALGLVMCSVTLLYMTHTVITFCNCERDVECIVEGKFHTEDNVLVLY